MTVAFVFRPDLGPVMRRALSRMIGTLAGVGIAALVAIAGNQQISLIVLCCAMAAAVPWAAQRSHALTVMVFTPIVFVFVGVLGPDQSLFGPSHHRYRHRGHDRPRDRLRAVAARSFATTAPAVGAGGYRGDASTNDTTADERPRHPTLTSPQRPCVP